MMAIPGIKIPIEATDNASAKINGVSKSIDMLKLRADSYASGLTSTIKSQNDFASILMQSGQQMGLNSRELMQMATTTGMYSQKQLQTAQSTATLSQAAAELTKQVDAGKITAKEAGAQYAKMAEEQFKAIKSTETFSDVLEANKTILLAAAAAAVTLVVELYNLGKAGAQVQRVEDSFQQLATTAGASSDYMLQKLRQASQGAISDAELMLSANKAMMLGVTANTDEMARLLEIAAIRGRAMGLSTTQAFNDIVTGIGRASPQILDNLGIMGMGVQVYNDYAESVGKTTAQLTKQEKTQILLQKVLDDGNRLLEQSGGLALDTAASYEQLEASWTNLYNAIAESTAGFIGGFGTMASMLDFATRLVKNFTVSWKNLIPIYGTILTIQAGINAVIATGTETILKNIPVADDAETRYNDLAKSLGMATDEMTGLSMATDDETQSAQDAEKATQALTRALQDKLSLIGKITDDTQNYTDKQNDLKDKIADLNAELAITVRRYGENSKKAQDIREKIGELNGELDANADAWEMNSRRSILAMLEKELAIDGLSQKEYTYLLELGKQWGVYSQEAVDAAQKAWREVTALKNVLDNLPTWKDIYINAYINQIGKLDSNLEIPMNVPTTNPTKPQPQEYAEGGQVYAGVPAIVGERGRELFVPYTNGQIVPNGRFGMGGASVTINYAPTISTASKSEVNEIFAPIVRDAMRQVRMGVGA